MADISAADLRTIITDPNGAMALVQKADKLGEELAKNKLTTSQIRSIFSEVRQIQAQWEMDAKQLAAAPEGKDSAQQIAWRRLVLLKPKMAYRAKRSGKVVQDLVAVLDPAVDQVLMGKDRAEQFANFRRFVDFFEAILAYHKYHGGN